MPANALLEREPVTREELVRFARQAFEFGDALDWKSYDPFDILLSPYLRGVRRVSPLGARAVVQVGRRSGARLRRVLGVRPHEEPKALADFTQAAVLLARCGEQWADEYLPRLTQRLRAHAVAAESGQGWGLGFPFVSRFGPIEPSTPILYTTTAVCQALLDDYGHTGSTASLEAAMGGYRFIQGGLGWFEHRGRRWLPYTPGGKHPIVNVQASAASFLARIATHHDAETALDTADRAFEAVVASQRPDGSWTYSDDDVGAFVDGYHTGFILQGLKEYEARRSREDMQGVGHVLATGYAYFKEHLLAADGLPRGFADGPVDLDGQSVAQCIQTLLVCGDSDDAGTALRVWSRGIEPLPGGSRASAVSPARSLRWSVGPAVLATAYLLVARAGRPG